MTRTMGSLFDGSGGFPLASKLLGIQPIWSSEIEPFPICVTKKNLPEVKHLGNISKLNGASIPSVDIITFGSPCQDLSIAGKRSGLDGDKSRLFYEAIRIIKEMREKTNGEQPRFIVWENVPGAFSSNKGEDFRCVLESICQIKEKDVFIPQPKKWQSAGNIVGNDYSICWRVLDAQYFGVPQRRKRIFLIADFNSPGGHKILFESQSMSRDFRKSQETWKGIANYFKTSTPKHSNYSLIDQGGERMDVLENVTSTLKAKGGHPPFVFENHGQDLRYTGPLITSPTIGVNPDNQPFVVNDARSYDVRFTSDNTINARGNVYETETARTLDTQGNHPDANQGGIAIVNRDVYATSKSSFHTIAEKEMVGSLVATDYKDPPIINQDKFIVRRLTPKECGRLQGFPDDWCEHLENINPTNDELRFWNQVFKEHQSIFGKNKKPKSLKQIKKWLSQPFSDSAAYKMWGNGVALPVVMYVLQAIKTYVENE